MPWKIASEINRLLVVEFSVGIYKITRIQIFLQTPYARQYNLRLYIFEGKKIKGLFRKIVVSQGLLYLDGRNSQKYLHQDQAYI